MKKWENAVIEEVNFTSTENGGMPSRNFDQTWYDENGASHVNFVNPDAES